MYHTPGEATQRLKRIKIKHRKKDAIFPAWIANFPDPARKFPVPFRTATLVPPCATMSISQKPGGGLPQSLNVRIGNLPPDRRVEADAPTATARCRDSSRRPASDQLSLRSPTGAARALSLVGCSRPCRSSAGNSAGIIATRRLPHTRSEASHSDQCIATTCVLAPPTGRSLCRAVDRAGRLLTWLQSGCPARRNGRQRPYRVLAMPARRRRQRRPAAR